MLFCVSPSHPNLESFDCFSATQIPILDLTCMYYFSIFCVSTQHSKLASHCAYARQIQQAIVALPQGAFRAQMFRSRSPAWSCTSLGVMPIWRTFAKILA